MSLNRYAKRRDSNEQEIVDALEAIGCSVVRLDKPVDLLVGHSARCYLLEIKGENGRLTQGQKDFMKTWQGQVRVVTTPEEAIEVILGCYVSTDSTDLSGS